MIRTMTWIGRGALAAVLAVGLSATTTRADLVVNGGFEEGGPANFVSPIPDWNGDGAFTATTFDEGPHTGDNAAFFGFVGSLGTISQDLATTPGASYDFSFWLASDGRLPNQFVVDWGAQEVLNLSNIPAGPYMLFSFIVMATGPVTTISFSGQNDPAYLALDDVSVNLRPVPEPGSALALAVGGLLVVGWKRRRARSVA